MPFADVFAALRWWLVLLVVGVVSFPITYSLLHRLADRGYAVTKMLGLLLTSYLFWLLGSFGFVGNTLGGIALALLLVGAAAIWFDRRDGGGARRWLRANWTLALTAELVFLLSYVLWTVARAQNPTITATEKPMEFAFLNAATGSPAFPPLDPWLSGFAISYYYFGYVMTGLLARLAVVPTAIAFNLGVAWLAAGTSIGAFGLVYNLIMARRAPEEDDAAEAPGAGVEPARAALLRGLRRRALTLGLLAAVALPIAGNMNILFETLHANGLGSDAFWQWLDIREIDGPAADPALTTPRYEESSWWWWRSSRVIFDYYLDGSPESGWSPIHEFPSFSFVLGDLHPHVLALPFAFLALFLALSVWLRPQRDLPEGAGPIAALGRIVYGYGLSTWLLTALILGGLSFLNTWDVLIHLFIVVAAYLLAGWRDSGRWSTALLWRTVGFGLLVAVPAYLLYYPFYLGFDSQAGAPFLLPMLMRPTRLAHFLVIFGMPLLVLLVWLLTQLRAPGRQGWRVGLIAAGGLLLGLHALLLLFGAVIAMAPEGAGRVAQLAGDLGVALAPAPGGGLGQISWGIGAVLRLTGPILAARLAFPWLILLLGGMVAAVVALLYRRLTPEAGPSAGSKRQVTVTPFILLLLLTALLLTLGPEFVYLKDNFSFRLNTVFKFYYQAWVLLGVTALWALDYLWSRYRPVAMLTGGAYLAALAVALLFPFYAIQSRGLEFRGPATAEARRAPTLDGLAAVRLFNPDEAAALQWLAANAAANAVIVEAVGGQYSGYGRISAATGRPTLLGWAGHEYQWRGYDTPEPPLREEAVNQIYGDAGWSTALEDVLNLYDVRYIYVGGLERSSYSAQGVDKFADHLPVAFASGNVVIYQWQPE